MEAASLSGWHIYPSRIRRLRGIEHIVRSTIRQKKEVRPFNSLTSFNSYLYQQG